MALVNIAVNKEPTVPMPSKTNMAQLGLLSRAVNMSATVNSEKADMEQFYENMFQQGRETWWLCATEEMWEAISPTAIDGNKNLPTTLRGDMYQPGFDKLILCPSPWSWNNGWIWSFNNVIALKMITNTEHLWYPALLTALEYSGLQMIQHVDPTLQKQLHDLLALQHPLNSGMQLPYYGAKTIERIRGNSQVWQHVMKFNFEEFAVRFNEYHGKDSNMGVNVEEDDGELNKEYD